MMDKLKSQMMAYDTKFVVCWLGSFLKFPIPANPAQYLTNTALQSMPNPTPRSNCAARLDQHHVCILVAIARVLVLVAPAIAIAPTEHMWLHCGNALVHRA